MCGYFLAPAYLMKVVDVLRLSGTDIPESAYERGLQPTPFDRVFSQNVLLLHLAYCLSNGATIQLHATFLSQNTGSSAKCLSAATTMIVSSNLSSAQVGLATLVAKRLAKFHK
ncbi:hypothetical protein BJV77DRAFT_965910 [Russula vinacea]|nr:hypothetical protein BJV77DRAFT_965910 [Russula vinacea]